MIGVLHSKHGGVSFGFVAGWSRDLIVSRWCLLRQDSPDEQSVLISKFLSRYPRKKQR